MTDSESPTAPKLFTAEELDRIERLLRPMVPSMSQDSHLPLDKARALIAGCREAIELRERNRLLVARVESSSVRETELEKAWAASARHSEALQKAESERDAAKAEALTLREKVLACAHCGKPATCVGAYESNENPQEPACDDCCGHGNEDGHCEPIANLPARLTKAHAEWEKAEAERDALREQVVQLREAHTKTQEEFAARVKELEAEATAAVARGDDAMSRLDAVSSECATLARLAEEVVEASDNCRKYGTGYYGPMVGKMDALSAFLATNEPPKDAVREAAKLRLEAGHNDRCDDLTVRRGTACSCGHDGLAAALRETP